MKGLRELPAQVVSQAQLERRVRQARQEQQGQQDQVGRVDLKE